MKHERNVIVLVFDTLRPDYLTCYESDRDWPAETEPVQTDGMDSLAAEGVRFTDAFAVGPGTPISHGGLFTGQYPSNSGITGQYIDPPAENPTMAEWFQSRGYKTVGIAGPSKIASDFGYDRGFDHYFEPYYDIGYKDHKPTGEYFKNAFRDREIFSDAVRSAFKGEGKFTQFKFDHLKNRVRDSDRPFFGFANLLEAHAPYYPPRGYREQYDPEFDASLHFALEIMFERLGSHANEDVRLERVKEAQGGSGIGQYLADPSYLNDAELEVMHRWYRASIKYLDEEFARFLEFYREELADDTYLVVTADHGEQFGEHGLIGHSHYLYDETLQVPLLVAGPDLPESETVTDMASLADLYPTVADLAGIVTPSFTDGRRLFEDPPRDAVCLEHGERDRSQFSETAHGRYLSRDMLRDFAAGRKAIRTETHKLVVDSRGTETLYDVTTRPETELEDSAVSDRLRERLFETLPEEFGEWPEGDPSRFNLNEDVVDNLEDLGYL